MTLSHADLWGTTTTPCPAWCTLEPGHGYDLARVDSDTRFHEHLFGEVDRGDRIAAAVALLAEENVTMGGGGVVISVEAARLVLESDGKGLTADQARESLHPARGSRPVGRGDGVVSTTCPEGTLWCTEHEPSLVHQPRYQDRRLQRLPDQGSAGASSPR